MTKGLVTNHKDGQDFKHSDREKREEKWQLAPAYPLGIPEGRRSVTSKVFSPRTKREFLSQEWPARSNFMARSREKDNEKQKEG